MKALRIALNVSAALLLISTAICGLWLRGQGAAVDPSSVGFHMTIGLLAVIVGVLALGLSTFGRTVVEGRRAEGESARPSAPSGILANGR